MDNLLKALDKAADGAFIIDHEQRIVYWNQAAQQLLGYSAEEVAGRACFEIVRGRGDHGQAWCRGNCYVAAAARADQSIDTFGLCAHTKSGGPRWIDVSILALPIGEDGETPLIVHLFRDATEARQREAFARQVLEAVQALQTVSAAVDESAPDLLTRRELEILKLLARGLSTQSIALSLSISVSTARNHIQSILQKLQVHSRPAAVAYAYEHGLLARE